MITGGYDYDSCIKFPEILEADEAGVVVSAECAHLFSESAQDGNKVTFLVSCLITSFLISNKSSEYAGTAFTMLKMFGLEHEVDKLLGGQVNTLSNVLTLSHEVHKAFDRFGIWLEEIPGEVRFMSQFFLLHDKAIQIAGKYLYCENG
jgi:hypothetical protein